METRTTDVADRSCDKVLIFEVFAFPNLRVVRRFGRSRQAEYFAWAYNRMHGDLLAFVLPRFADVRDEGEVPA